MDEELLDRCRAIGREVNKRAQRANGSRTLCVCEGIAHSPEDHYCGICGLPLHSCTSIEHYGRAVKYRVVKKADHKSLEYRYEKLIKRIKEEREQGGKKPFGFLKKDGFYADLVSIIEEEVNFSTIYRSFGGLWSTVCRCEGIAHSPEDHYCGKCGLHLGYEYLPEAYLGVKLEVLSYTVVNAFDRQLLEYKLEKLMDRIKEEKGKIGIIAYLKKDSFLSDLEAIIALKNIPFLIRMCNDKWCPD